MDPAASRPEPDATLQPNTAVTPRPRLLRFLVAAPIVGLVIMALDRRLGWDDTGITAGLVLIAAASFTALRPAHPWLWALAIGLWIPLAGIFTAQDYGSLLALAVAFLGAYTGSLVVKTWKLFR